MVDRIEVWSKRALEELMGSHDELGSEMEQKFGQKEYGI